MIASCNLEKQAKKIYLKITKVRKKGWFSQDITEMLINKYGSDKKQMLEQIKDNQKQVDKLHKENRELAKKVNKIK